MTTDHSLDRKTYCYNEYDKLERVIVCEPHYMTIRDVINDTQKQFKDVGIHIEKAVEQHTELAKTLRNEGIEVILLPYHKKFPEQVFTRDIGFTLGQTVFVAKMAVNVRKGEEGVLKRWLDDEDLSYYNLNEDRIEGGDVIIDRDTIYIGLSERTSKNAARHLQSLLPKFNIIPVPFKEKFLHLDCVFNVVSPDTALIFPEALSQENIDLFSSRYDLIKVSKEEQFTLGTNVLAIGNNKIISLPGNKNVNKELRQKGFQVIEVDITEIIKSGGSFRCCTLPILRGEYETELEKVMKN